MAKPRHPLRIIRAATPHATQAAFAAFLGVPVAVVQAVESGKAGMTVRLAGHIREMTGADERELLRGDEGKALNLAGRRYTAHTFAAWSGSPQQSEERRRRKAVLTSQRDAWKEYLRAAAPGKNGAKRGNREITAVEDHLIPWQRCEFAAAAAGAWRRLPESLLRLTGWSRDITLPSRTMLTLSVQAAPAWNPDGPPPGLSAANADLFPPCYFTVAAGSGGCRAAAAFWKTVCREHAIHPDNGRPVHGSPTGSWRGFFRPQEERCEPHAVFAGIEPAEAADLNTGLFPGDGILCGPADDSMADQMLAFMSEHSEDAGSPAGILLFASLEGGTASALGSLLLTKFREKFPSVPVIVVGVLPLAGVSPVMTAPWHTALAMRAIRRSASAALLFSNDLLLAQASRVWNLASPGYAEANLLIAECLSTFTAPLRFGGSDAHPVDLAALLAGFPPEAESGVPLITAQCWPLAALSDRRQKSTALPWLVQKALAAAKRSPFAAREDTGVGIFLRVRLFPGEEWTTGSEPPAVKLSGRIGTGLHESATVFSPSPVIQRTLKRLAKQGRDAWHTDNSGAACAELGVTEGELHRAIEEMAE